MTLINNVGTFNLNSETIVIKQDFGIRNISILLVGGTVTVKGVLPLGLRTDDAIVLTAGVPLNLTFDYSIDGVTIDASAGQATLIVGR